VRWLKRHVPWILVAELVTRVRPGHAEAAEGHAGTVDRSRLEGM